MSAKTLFACPLNLCLLSNLAAAYLFVLFGCLSLFIFAESSSLSSFSSSSELYCELDRKEVFKGIFLFDSNDSPSNCLVDIYLDEGEYKWAGSNFADFTVIFEMLCIKFVFSSLGL